MLEIEHFQFYQPDEGFMGDEIRDLPSQFLLFFITGGITVDSGKLWKVEVELQKSIDSEVRASTSRSILRNPKVRGERTTLFSGARTTNFWGFLRCRFWFVGGVSYIKFKSHNKLFKLGLVVLKRRKGMILSLIFLKREIGCVVLHNLSL